MENKHTIPPMTDNCRTPFERESCLQCALKHLSQARVLTLESHKGYPVHIWFAMGHMAEAEDELLSDHPEMSEMVRNERLRLQQDATYDIDFEDLVRTLLEYDDNLANEILGDLNA